jgi:hypothetical protein
MPEEIKLNQPAPVVRHEMGSFQHPDMPDFDEDDGDKCKAWVAEQRLKVAMVSLEYADEAVADRYFESGDPVYSYWEPAPRRRGLVLPGDSRHRRWPCLLVGTPRGGGNQETLVHPPRLPNTPHLISIIHLPACR